MPSPRHWIELARTDDRIVAVCNDSVGSSKLVDFRDEFPDRLINVGIAEQNMIGVGAGLADAGLHPVRLRCRTVPDRARSRADQGRCRLQPARRRSSCGMSPGIAYGELGPTHHSIEDLSWLRALPGLEIVVPADRRADRAVP